MPASSYVLVVPTFFVQISQASEQRPHRLSQRLPCEDSPHRTGSRPIDTLPPGGGGGENGNFLAASGPPSFANMPLLKAERSAHPAKGNLSMTVYFFRRPLRNYRNDLCARSQVNLGLQAELEALHDHHAAATASVPCAAWLQRSSWSWKHWSMRVLS